MDQFNAFHGYLLWAISLTSMAADDTWCDHVTHHALLNCFKTSIHVISSLLDHHNLTIS